MSDAEGLKAEIEDVREEIRGLRRLLAQKQALLSTLKMELYIEEMPPEKMKQLMEAMKSILPPKRPEDS